MESQIITEIGRAVSRRRYDDACGTAHALDLIGERWALLVMRELMLGPKRFGDIRADLPGISANVLTQRLEGLEASGLLMKRRLPPPASAQGYELTQWGYEAEPIVKSLELVLKKREKEKPEIAKLKKLLNEVVEEIRFHTSGASSSAESDAGSRPNA